MELSIKVNKIILKNNSLLDNFLKYREKYLLTMSIEIGDIVIKKGDYYFTAKNIKEN